MKKSAPCALVVARSLNATTVWTLRLKTYWGSKDYFALLRKQDKISFVLCAPNLRQLYVSASINSILLVLYQNLKVFIAKQNWIYVHWFIKRKIAGIPRPAKRTHFSQVSSRKPFSQKYAELITEELCCLQRHKRFISTLCSRCSLY